MEGGALAGVVASVSLASVNLRLPIVLAGLGFLRSRRLHGARDAGGRVHQTASVRRVSICRTAFTTTLKEGVGQVRAHHVLLLILAVAALHGASTEGFDRLVGLPPASRPRPSFAGQPRPGGVVRHPGRGRRCCWGSSRSSVVKRRAHLEGHAAVAKILMGIDALLIVSVVVFGLAGQFWMALLAFWVVGALRSGARSGLHRVDQPGARSEDAGHDQLDGFAGRRRGSGRGRAGPGAGRDEASRRRRPSSTSGLLSAARDRALHPRDPTRFGGHAEARGDEV